MTCIICNEDVAPISWWFEKDLGFAVHKSEIKINKDICEKCFKPESVTGLCPKKDIYLVSIQPYVPQFEKDFWDQSEFERSDILSVRQITDRLVEEGILTTNSSIDRPDYHKRGRDWVLLRDPRIMFKLKVPIGNCLDLVDKNFVKKKDLDFWIDVTKRNPMLNQKFVLRKKYDANLSDEKIERFTYMGYIRFDKEGVLRVAHDSVNKKRICGDCTELLDFDCFRRHSQNGNITVYTCLKCESERQAIYYQKNGDHKRESTRKWRQSERGKELVKKYRKKPEIRVYRNLRKRLRDFRETSGNNYGKDIGKTNKELTAYLESLFPVYIPEMTWDDYGSGENKDHKNCWHIDHIIPLGVWDQFKYVHPLYFEGMSPNHWSNLRPLDAIENISRGMITTKRYWEEETKVIDLEEVNSHFLMMADLYPDEGFGELNIDALENREVKEEEVCEQTFLSL